MKKFILAMAIVLAMFPVLSHAQSAQIEVQEAYRSALRQVIALLIQQLTELQKKLAEQLNAQAVQLSQIQNTQVAQGQQIQQIVAAQVVPSPTPTVTPAPTVVPSITPTPALYSIDVLATSYSVSSTNFQDKKNSDFSISKGKFNLLTLVSNTFGSDGKKIQTPVTVTTNYPGMPATFIQKPSTSFYVGNKENGFTGDCKMDNSDCEITQAGIFYFTFSQPDLNVSRTIQVTVTE